ncbi:serine hydrolase [Nocardia puris]|uniref:D-alanyl-D-alanine carboxypeptidase (Penicillin-binding protein 5/6) n=1 Tax=Nocardia puris TaxID=208602 RepID=A0A366D829_9NOCA|nr:D-alanyl-D-alanine carboxypeptidase family protein [Nocardia puris]MBF6212419.1 serine hydrolase [Nocardia puris]MBF6366666.1 serine hydrolase [Nocardia puris]MBF6461008.1 serine hydrolase [Nocardia puris]RBO85659.1 D-alanyl-D-alanine carboxypeptidase (penicillin-binding protein 5/6) [Nocardia puris]
MTIPPTHRRTARRLASVLAVVAVLGGAAPAFATPSTTTTTPFTTPNTDACPQRTQPPAPVDSSEVPRPGQPTPSPLPVPATPIGGPRMGECGVVLPDGAPSAPRDLSATAWLVADLDTGEVLAAKDPHGRYRPASTIKVLLAAVALRELDMNTEVVGTQADADMEGTRVGIGPGGRYTNRQLMQALIMASGNDAAHAIAAQLGGDEATVRLMNERAKSLSALDTRAATPSGLDGPGMSTSAYDLAVLFRDAMTLPLFAELIRTEQVDFPGYPKNPTILDDTDHPGFPIGNDNQLLYNYEGALGGKTGFTDDARQTFVAAAQRDGRRLVVTLLQAEVEPSRPWRQAADLLDYAFALPAATSVGTLPGPDAPTEADVVLASPPPKDTADILAGPPREREHAGLRTMLVVGGIIAILVLLLGARSVNRRKR